MSEEIDEIDETDNDAADERDNRAADVPAELQGGTARQITYYGNPVLHHPCEEVTVFDDDLRVLIKDMFASMYAAHGVGLAANQIGVNKRIFVIDCGDDDGNRVLGYVINPVLHLPADDERELEIDHEGCLSVPGPYEDLGRVTHAHVHGVDLDENPVTLAGAGYIARCLQHETDHLDGLLYVDRLPIKVRKRLLKEAGL